jgi:hypothetical protein
MPLSCAEESPLANLEGVVYGLLLGDRAPFELGAERLALQKLGDSVGDATVHPEIEDREDVRVGERC